MDQVHQVLEREDFRDFVDGIAYGEDKETAPEQTVPLLVVAGQNIRNQQDVLKHIVQRAIDWIRFVNRGNKLIDKAENHRGDHQDQCRRFLSESSKDHGRCHAGILDAGADDIIQRSVMHIAVDAGCNLVQDEQDSKNQYNRLLQRSLFDDHAHHSFMRL